MPSPQTYPYIFLPILILLQLIGFIYTLHKLIQGWGAAPFDWRHPDWITYVNPNKKYSSSQIRLLVHVIANGVILVLLTLFFISLL